MPLPVASSACEARTRVRLLGGRRSKVHDLKAQAVMCYHHVKAAMFDPGYDLGASAQYLSLQPCR